MDMYGVINQDGNVVLFHSSGEQVTRLEQETSPLVWSLNSDLSAYYEHPEGIVLNSDDAKKLKIKIE